MQKLFSTADVQEGIAFRRWREICEDRLVPMAQSSLSDRPFHATIHGACIGELNFTKFVLGDLRATTNSQSVRHHNNKTDFLYLSMMLDGTVASTQNDTSTIDQTGDIIIRDTSTPWTIEHRGRTEVIAVEIPRVKLESVLGSARNFAGLTMDARHPATILTRSFLCDLVRVGHELTRQSAERMTLLGVDLVSASLSERMARGTPKSLKDMLTIQTAKSYIIANFYKHSMRPSDVAAAAGVSLRVLQILFRKEGCAINALIWQKRLEKAANLLADRNCYRMTLGELSFRCGFEDQAYFSRYFRRHFGMSPRDYRHAAFSQSLTSGDAQAT
ncbi:AraC family transcriptional regulator [uncultured Methylobacterium sp.]|jgi:AraC family transcriptional activator of tynA and feaB|uniref:AraC family transcriptional regulator n=1 Tax=uncultured Methylobacterium sp. TaxID=157278 RepID=UPI00260D2D8E|nr:AraC family transcriptional regulator [uncultured Methylobacterium sp.]